MGYNSVDDPVERRRAQIRASVARHKERLSQLTRLEQAAYKARATLGPDFCPYTEEEQAQVDKIVSLISELELATNELNGALAARLGAEVSKDPRLAVLLSALINGDTVRVTLKPY